MRSAGAGAYWFFRYLILLAAISLLRALFGAWPKRKERAALLVQMTTSRPLNSFYSMIPEAVRRRGIDVVYSRDFARVALLACRRANVLVHLHQVEPFLGGQSSWSYRRLTAWLDFLRSQGVRLLWTMHNERPHAPRVRAANLEEQFRVYAGKAFDRVVVLSRASIPVARRYFPEDRIVMIRHPNYRSVVDPELTRARPRVLSRPAAADRVFLAFGTIQPYKGLDLVIRAFSRACGERHRLVIAGLASDPEYLERLRRTAKVNPRVKIIAAADGIALGEAVSLFMSADFAVFGHSEVLNSGAVLFALSCGKPVIAPGIGALPELVRDGVNGFQYAASSEESLSESLRRGIEDTSIVRDAVLGSVAHLDLGPIADQYAALYRSLASA